MRSLEQYSISRLDILSEIALDILGICAFDYTETHIDHMRASDEIICIIARNENSVKMILSAVFAYHLMKSRGKISELKHSAECKYRPPSCSLIGEIPERASHGFRCRVIGIIYNQVFVCKSNSAASAVRRLFGNNFSNGLLRLGSLIQAAHICSEEREKHIPDGVFAV